MVGFYSTILDQRCYVKISKWMVHKPIAPRTMFVMEILEFLYSSVRLAKYASRPNFEVAYGLACFIATFPEIKIMFGLDN